MNGKTRPKVRGVGTTVHQVGYASFVLLSSLVMNIILGVYMIWEFLVIERNLIIKMSVAIPLGFFVVLAIFHLIKPPRIE